MMKRLILALLVILAPPARAAGPVIWSAQNTAQMLNAGDLVAKDGSTYQKYTEKDYVKNASGTVDTTGWTATGTATVTRVTSGIPRATLGYALQFGGGAAADYVRYRYTVDAADQGKKLKIAFDQKPGTYTASDWQVDNYCTSDSSYATGLTRKSLSTDSSSISGLPNLSGTYRTTFDSDTTSIYCELRLTRAAGTSTIALSDVVVGPGVVTQGAAVTGWQSCTATVSWSGTGMTTTCQYRRIGDSIQERVAIVPGSGALSGGALTVSVPSGLTINTGALAGGSGTPVGGWLGYHNATLATYLGNVNVNTTTNVTLSYNASGGSGSYLVSTTNPATWATTSDEVAVDFTVPVNEWTGSGTVNLANSDLSYYYGTGGTWGTSSTITTAQGAGGVLGGTTTPASTSFAYTLAPTTPVPVGTKPVLEISPDGTHWSPVGAGTVTAQYIESLRFDGTNFIGAQAGLNSSGQIVVTFGKYAAGTSAAWSGTWYWRVTVGLPGQAVGFSMASDTSAGLVKLPTGYTQTTVADYQTDDTTLAAVTFLGNGAGSAASSAIAVRVTRSGRLVTVSVPALTTVIPSGTSTHIDANTAFPTWARPAISWQSPAWVYNANATWAVGLINVTTTGFIQFYRDQASTAFTAGSNAGWSTISFTYPVN